MRFTPPVLQERLRVSAVRSRETLHTINLKLLHKGCREDCSQEPPVSGAIFDAAMAYTRSR